MNSRRKICFVVTARPSYSRIRTALRAAREHSELELQLVVAASALLARYGSAADVIEADGFRIDRRVHMVVEGESLVTSAKTTGYGLAELASVFEDLRPDAVVTIADRFETIATAIAASYLNIPLVHVQGGEITGSIDEKVRHAITKLADHHFVSTEQAARNVIRMGEVPERVVVTGCPSIDLVLEAESQEQLDSSTLFKRHGGVGPELDLSKGYLVVLQHPVTTEYADREPPIKETLLAIKSLNRPALWFWPNVDAGSDATSKEIRRFRELHHNAPIHFFRNLPPELFVAYMRHCDAMVGNSSAGIREASFLGTPAINIGPRQSGRERGPNVTDVGYDHDEIIAAVVAATESARPKPSTLYGDGKAGIRIAQELETIELSVEKRLPYSARIE